MNKSPTFQEVFVFLKIKSISIVIVTNLIVATPSTSEKTLAVLANVLVVDLFWYVVNVNNLIHLIIIFFYWVAKD